MIRHNVGIGSAKKRIDRRIARLDHRPDLLDEIVGYAELVLPPLSVECTCSRSNRATSRGPGCEGTGYWNGRCPASEGNGEREADQGAHQAAPSCALTCGHLVALVDA